MSAFGQRGAQIATQRPRPCKLADHRRGTCPEERPFKPLVWCGPCRERALLETKNTFG